MKREALLCFVLFLAGCASQQAPLLMGVSESGTAVCLEDQAVIPGFVQKFYETRDLTTEEGKIDYLIERVKSSDLTFIRNKVEYTGPAAASFLRWKLSRMESRHHVKIKTAEDFVSEVVSGSRITGEPYTVILKDGSRHNFQNVLQNELDVLESCLRRYSARVEKSDSDEKRDQAPSVPSTKMSQ